MSCYLEVERIAGVVSGLLNSDGVVLCLSGVRSLLGASA
jgi:hypothetical protein